MKYCPLLCLVLVLTACGPRAPLSERDAAALAQVREEFGGKLVFATTDGLYLDARLRPHMLVDDAELDRLHRRFFLDSLGSTRATGFVYLNLYDARGRFVKQVWWDPATGEFRRQHTERY